MREIEELYLNYQNDSDHNEEFMSKEIDLEMDKIEKFMDKYGLEARNELIDLVVKYSAVEQCHSFCIGFRYAVRLLADCTRG